MTKILTEIIENAKEGDSYFLFYRTLENGLCELACEDEHLWLSHVLSDIKDTDDFHIECKRHIITVAFNIIMKDKEIYRKFLRMMLEKPELDY